MNLADLRTPALVLDRTVVMRNTAQMTARMKAHGVRLRPHLKTAKSVEVARLATLGNFGGITVSTLAEAEYFAAHGFRDICYAVGLVPAKFAAAARLAAEGVRVTTLTDDLATAEALLAYARQHDARFAILIEIDTGQHRAGLDPEAPELIELARSLDAPPHVRLAGVLGHAGHSYHAKGAAAIAVVAEEERAKLVRAAARIEAAGIACPERSAGATPTALCGTRFDGLTEMRPGVYTLFDLAQHGLGLCRLEDIAVSVLASVIGHNRTAGHVLIDAGFMALTRDFGAHEFLGEVGYGFVMEERGRARIDMLVVNDANQEHGMIRVGTNADYARLPVGARVRILPNHACATAAMHARYHVVEADEQVHALWERCGGW
jgi:D-serine deaminase-like pyridoxal phosphate-dependent protein